MSDPINRYSDNVPGPYYVDDQCIICGLCDELAPSIFKISQDGDHNVVHRQPQTESEVALAEEVLSSCPVEAICNDGS